MKKILTTVLFTASIMCASAQTPKKLHIIKYDTVVVDKNKLNEYRRVRRKWHWAVTGFISFTIACIIFDRSK